MFSSKHS